ncbi:SMI1/KNR4 family protein [Hymenobacter sp. BT186]|uniref:SMI1/KNR4 family protein n=1 Tax=Hymenobacter telluris TaxID=2816474 RepID=A0A939EZ86_9BACT|nr:SMI1/KNR4 family protein [Hymenobacter telluris]MBO0360198.1 SMI1/KNR4 family protein [Hymenobacter telluris]MBW3376225.1 SMI1/KNR4 family protein [Hymenobacter norwichensis]
MTPTDIRVVHQFVDVALQKLRDVDLMRLPYANMPLEMQDETGTSEDDWLPWKPVPSTVTDSDITELEAKTKLRYPDLYKEFLHYKHFYDLWPQQEINFFRHGIYEWKAKLLARYFDAWDPSKLIEQGLIYFADYSDWGIVCFDANSQNKEDHDCPVVMIDHELLHSEPVPKQVLYPSFAAMMYSLVADQQDSNVPD